MNQMVSSSFGNNLKENWRSDVLEFKQAWTDTGVTSTPIIHIIKEHIIPFCLDKKKGLGFYSEQSFEYMHYDFKMFWEFYKLNDPEAEQYPHRLKRALVAYNS